MVTPSTLPENFFHYWWLTELNSTCCTVTPSTFPEILSLLVTHRVVFFCSQWLLALSLRFWHYWWLTELCSPCCTATPSTLADSFFKDGLRPPVSCRNGLYLDVSRMFFFGWSKNSTWTSKTEFVDKNETVNQFTVQQQNLCLPEFPTWLELCLMIQQIHSATGLHAWYGFSISSFTVKLGF